MSQPKRIEIKVRGSSRNPEYNIASGPIHFRREEDGRRIAPISQLNTHVGRLLAEEESLKALSYTEGFWPPIDLETNRQRARPLNNDALERQGRSEQGIYTSRLDPRYNTSLNPGKDSVDDMSIGKGHPTSDRDRLTSQRPRTELSQLLGMTRGSSRKGTVQGTLSTSAPSSIDLSLVCPECKQPNPATSRGRSASLSHICSTCHRFVTATEITTPQAEPRPAEPKLKVKPIPPSRYPTSLVCDTCLVVPEYLYQEFLQFFPTCPACGQMTDTTLVNVVGSGGEVTGLTDDDGRQIFGASKELQDWCVYISRQGHFVSRLSSKKSTDSSISSTSSSGLTRSGAIHRTPTSSTTSSKAGSMRSSLYLVSEISWKGSQSTRRFSFDTIQEVVTPDVAGTIHGPNGAGGQLSFHSSDLVKTVASMQTLDIDNTEMPYQYTVETFDSQQVRADSSSQERNDPDHINVNKPLSQTECRPALPKRTFTEILGERSQLELGQVLRRQPAKRSLVNVHPWVARRTV